MNIRPLGDRLVLKQIEAEEKTKSGIILPSSTAKEKPSIFEVVVVGNGIQNDGTEVKMILKVGDKVVANKYSGLTVKVDEDDLVILRQSDILAVMED